MLVGVAGALGGRAARPPVPERIELDGAARARLGKYEGVELPPLPVPPAPPPAGDEPRMTMGEMVAEPPAEPPARRLKWQ